MEVEIPPRSSTFESLNVFFEHVRSCQAASVKVTGGEQTIIAVMKGVKVRREDRESYGVHIICPFSLYGVPITQI